MEQKKQTSTGKKILKVLGWIILAIVAVALCFLIFLSVTEYKPAEKEQIKVSGKAENSIKAGDSISVLSWNLGYGALGDNADFFFDGGKAVLPSDETRVKENVNAFYTEINNEKPDVALLQETDVNSKRSYGINMVDEIANHTEGYENSFAYNYNVKYVPYPMPPMGKIGSGLATFSSYPVKEAERLSLPCPFTWPVRVGNLKRCLLVNRVPVEGSNKELVLVNLHLEAYDDGEGKIAQTKMLRDLLEAEYKKGNYVIAAGDFNQTFSNTDTSMYPQHEGAWKSGIIDVADLGNDFTCIMDSSVPSCRSLTTTYDTNETIKNCQYWMLDGFIVSNNVKVESMETKDLQFKNTDHNPIILKAVLN